MCRDDEDDQNIACRSTTASIYSPQKALTLLRGKPIANRFTQPFGTLHAANASRRIGAREPTIRCLVRQPPDCRKPQVDRCRCITLLLGAGEGVCTSFQRRVSG